MIKLIDILKEIIDIYLPNELSSKNIQYDVVQESPRRCIVNLSYKDNYYSLRILPIFNPKRPSVNFGITDENFEKINMDKLINASHTPRILATIFGFLRYWVDKYNIQEFEYAAQGEVRNKLYEYYLKKHFSDFKQTQETFGNETIQVWKKI